ncbi:MAG: glycosyltransferase [Janthinobacterium lividum]
MGIDGHCWQVLQLSDALDLELATELARLAPTILWEPDRSCLPIRFGFREEERGLPESTLRIRRFPILRGYARAPLSFFARVGPALGARLAKHTPDPARSILVCTTPYFAPVAERWPGPVVYWLTDLMARYDGADPQLLRRLDRDLCRVATLVCPASERLAAYLRDEAGCPADRIKVVPNAARVANLLPSPLLAPVPPPGGHPWSGPVAGVLGNLGENMDWVFLQRVIDLTPWLCWCFVGPTEETIADREQAAARTAVMHHARTTFVGPKPYGELFHYARAFTVAVLPYRHREPTFSGSSTRFYEHLAACHPILATPGVAELQSKSPLLTLVPTPADAAAALEALRAQNFDDGLRTVRWQASRTNTWRQRACTMQAALAERLPETNRTAAAVPCNGRQVFST